MLNLTKFAVRKPVTIIMCLLTIAYFGSDQVLNIIRACACVNGADNQHREFHFRQIVLTLQWIHP